MPIDHPNWGGLRISKRNPAKNVKPQRNQTMLKRYQAGEPVNRIAKDEGLSWTRTKYIIEREATQA